MAEQDPREYRGGVHEPSDAKGGRESWADNEGVVPREMVDEPETTQDPGDPQALKVDALGHVTDEDETDQRIDKSAGDEADATTSADPGADAQDLEEGKPVSRVDQPNVTLQTEKGTRTG